MTDQLIVERGGLEKKDKSELQAIVEALGGTATSRARKADLIDQILELSGAALPAPDGDGGTDSEGDAAGATEPAGDGDAAGGGASAGESGSTDTSKAGTEPDKGVGPSADAAGGDGDGGDGRSDRPSSQRSGRSRAGNAKGADSKGADSTSTDGGDHPVGPDGEPLADWEVEVMADGNDGQSKLQKGGSQQSGRSNDRNRGGRNDQAGDKSKDQASNRSGGANDRSAKDRNANDRSAKDRNANDRSASDRSPSDRSDGDRNDGDDADPNNRRNRRRGRNRGRDRDDAGNDPVSTEPVPVEGALDLRDEGYGFLRVNGYLPSKDDVYVSVKQVRQYGLRKGDHITGLSRPANRNEKNPGFHQIDKVNGKPPDEGRERPRFDDLTPLFPDEQLVMSMREEPLNMTTRIIDLVAPIGKGQRGLIVSPPKAGKTTVIKDIARAIETNNPEVTLIVLLVDERPEEVTDMRRSLTNGEVASSTFDRPPEEHCAVAELTIERAKRMVEAGQDVCIILDGITRLARAYNLTAPQTGRAMSGGLDAAALYPPKRLLGAARNLEEGGSLTILATALVETGSKMDDVIFEEFKGTGNMELRLDRRLAEKRIFPAIDIDSSSTRNEELLFDRTQLKQAWKLRKVLSGMSEEGSSAAAIEMLIDRLQTFKTNDDFLAEIGKAPSV